MYYLSKAELEDHVRQAGEQAVFEAKCGEFHEELVKVLGRLRYRTSYGQHVLKHTLEVVHLTGIMASELGASVKTAKRAALLHDIGKAMTHEVEGSHAIISAQLAKRYGESQGVVHAIEAHHYEVQPQTVEAVLLIAADAISASRPGARGESLEHYIKRLGALEEIATAKPGVAKAYALQAGREIRVMVEPTEVDDDGAVLLSHEIAREIEDQLEYPGQVKVTVIRESGRPRSRSRDAGTIPPMRRYHVTTFGCQMNAHDSERIKGMLESLGLGEATAPEDADVLVFNTCTIREKPDTKLAAYLGDAGARKRAEPRPRRRRRRLLRRGAARADLRALPAGRRRVRPRLDPAPRRVDRRRRRGAARPLRHARALRRRPADAPRARLQRLGAGLDGLQLQVRVLHRPGRSRPRAEPPAWRDRRGGDAARGRRRQGDHAARPERQLVGPRPRARARDRVRRAAARLRRGRRDRADPLHEPAPEGLPRAGDRRDGGVRRRLRADPPAAPVRARAGS